MFNILLLDSVTGCCGCTLFCWWWAFWVAAAMLLGGFLYWLFWCRKKQEIIDRLTVERDGFHAQFTNAEKDLASLKYQLDEANKELARLKGALHSCEADKAILAARLEEGDGGAGKTAIGFADMPDSRDGDGMNYAAVLGSDNLQIVEGIGPKIDGLLKEAGISNWGALAATSVDRLQEILDAAGSRYKLADPKTWPQQAELADEGKWEELIEYQKFLDTGVETKGDFETPSKVEKLIVKLLGYSTNPEDLKIIEGVGPKIEGLMKDAGINNWAAVAATSVEKLNAILEEAGPRYKLADPSTWPEQAKLASEGKWDELKRYQDFLSGGKAPK
jgi:predicted flap endonuclease-1-like 5' DNA nuclease